LKKVAIISTHPIQYNAPLFRLLTDRKNVTVKVFYTWGQAQKKVFDPGFGKEREWDIPLLEGYDYEFIENTSTQPGSHHFKGIVNPGLIKKIEAYNPDALLIFGWSFESHLKAMRYFKGRKQIIFRGDSNLLDELHGFSLKKIIRQIFLTWIYRYIDIALYTGTANKNYYLKYGLKATQLVFAPHAIDNKRFMEAITANEDVVEQKRKEMGIAADAIVFIFAGKFEPKKNPQLLIDAFAKLKDEKAAILLVGDGILEVTLKTNVLNLPAHIRSRIHFLPFQNQKNMPNIYCMGNVFCLPSQGPGETWGLAVNEAMACSKPLLVSDKCGCSVDLVINGVNGFIVASNDSDDLHNKMNAIIENKERLTDMGKESLKFIQQWSYEKVCAAIEESMGAVKIDN
jgi:glycosyltransferase involved in cell wall biosynthesis